MRQLVVVPLAAALVLASAAVYPRGLHAQKWNDPPLPTETLVAGGSRSSELVRQRFVVGGSYVDRYLFRGRRGQVVTFHLDSYAFDPVLRLAGVGSDRQLMDDDSGFNNHARMTYWFDRDTTFVIGVFSAQPRETGAYRLWTEEAQAVITDNPVGHGFDMTLEDGDLFMRDGDRVADVYTLDGNAGDVYSITLRSDAFDALLAVFTPEGSPIADDDDSGDGTNAALEVALPRSGRYMIVASAVGSGSRGPYSLSVRPRRRETPPSGTQLYATEASLSSTSGRCAENHPCDQHVFEGRAGQRVAVILESSEFDPVVRLLDGRDGSTLGTNDDDPAGGRNSRLEVTLPYTGRYTVVARGFGGATGRYRVAVRGLP